MALASTQIRIRNKEGIPLTKFGTYLTHIDMDNIGVSDLARSILTSTCFLLMTTTI